jgi:neurofibromin 1
VTLHKQFKVAASGEMVHSVLVFLDACPLALFGGISMQMETGENAFEDIFAAFMVFLTSDDERIRALTSAVSRGTLTEGTTFAWRMNNYSVSSALKFNFWNSTYVCLISLEYTGKSVNTVY